MLNRLCAVTVLLTVGLSAQLAEASGSIEYWQGSVSGYKVGVWCRFWGGSGPIQIDGDVTLQDASGKKATYPFDGWFGRPKVSASDSKGNWFKGVHTKQDTIDGVLKTKGGKKFKVELFRSKLDPHVPPNAK